MLLMAWSSKFGHAKVVRFLRTKTNIWSYHEIALEWFEIWERGKKRIEKCVIVHFNPILMGKKPTSKKKNLKSWIIYNYAFWQNSLDFILG